jgi:adenine deaminase
MGATTTKSNQASFKIEGQIVDVRAGNIFSGIVEVVNGEIAKITPARVETQQFIAPGFIDAHVHIESSMLPPTEFARLAVPHGTVATISDPHEIGNVLGSEGVRYMIQEGKRSPFKFYFGAPSCVPATPFETAGAEIGVEEVRELLAMEEVRYLAEMMNFPGVLNRDPVVMAKIKAAHDAGKKVDGHAPGLRGDTAAAYIAAGISTDHECFTRPEAEDKLRHGMKILIREGSAAKNFDALISLLPDYPDEIMFCSDDKHPNDLVRGHLNLLAARAVAAGCEPMQVMQACSRNVVDHYGLKVGLLQAGDPADFIVLRDLEQFEVLSTWIDGQKVAETGASLLPFLPAPAINKFDAQPIREEDLMIRAESDKAFVIEVEDGQLITTKGKTSVSAIDGFVQSDPEHDVLKIAVLNRYAPASPAVALVRNFGLKRGAIASSVAHDSHNIIAVGVSDADLAAAINMVVQAKGGVALSDGDRREVLPLPVAGLMSNANGYEVAEQYEALDNGAKALGSSLASPFMTLSFCALLVIPHLKLSDLGLFDGDSFQFTPLFAH